MTFRPERPDVAEKTAIYHQLNSQLGALLSGETDPWANMANAASLVYTLLPDLNWAGFYLLRGGELVVGPFQGQPACVRIPLGRGVCGTAAATRRTQVVPDVHAFADHIACDAASNSEIVVPLLAGGRLIGVLDLDSPSLARFDAEDATGLEQAAALIVAACDWSLAGIDPT
jgi:L-methionine (R)-S-oxide reductase